MPVFLAKGLTETDVLWSDVRQGYAWVGRASHSLSNEEKLSAAQIRHIDEDPLAEVEQAPIASENLALMLSTFRKMTTSYWPSLFHCYDIPDLPRTNNELEQYFGSARYHERRATGRKQASPGLVVRGTVRINASVASRLLSFSGSELCPPISLDGARGASELDHLQETRRKQYRFRKSTETYLQYLEEKLSKERLSP